MGTLFYGQVVGSLAALAGIRLLCRRDRLPWTGRTALLPRRWVEAVFNNTVGLALHFAYPVVAMFEDLCSPLGIFAVLGFNKSLSISGAPRATRPAANAPPHAGIGACKLLICRPHGLKHTSTAPPAAGTGRFNDSVRFDHQRLHSNAVAAAAAAGRPLAPSLVVGSSVLPVSDANAVSIPGGRCALPLRQSSRSGGRW